MACCSETLPIRPSARRSRLQDRLTDAWHAYWAHRRQRATVLLLHSLSDRALEDIGIHRSEIESVVHDTSRERRHHTNWK
jgi:uncharacterized protein YjiS (DUF1127 family)